MLNVDAEFDRQLATMIEKGYPEVTGSSSGAFKELVEPLRELPRSSANKHSTTVSPSGVPFVLVVSERLARAESLVPKLALAGERRPGIVDPNHGDEGLAPYRPLPDLHVPDTGVYVLWDVERGDEFRGLPPEQVLPILRSRGRTPLTIHEGIALALQFPALLAKNHCFMLSGSRRGDRRVPALWISDKAPKLGWCWDGNPHSWLGTASCAARYCHTNPGGV